MKRTLLKSETRVWLKIVDMRNQSSRSEASMITPRKCRQSSMILNNNQGQSLILALLVMFLLVFIVGLFITLVARNMTRTAGTSTRLTTEYLADAGIQYVDDQLTYSEEGADWRPVPTYPEVVKLLQQGTPPEQIPSMLSPADLPKEGDPDYYWLIRGFSRYNYGRGRFLVRVTYDPKPNDPLSRYLKIESIGRIGEIDETDPTTFRRNQPMRARREKIAYKAIGITDYVRFVTNKDRRSGEFALGVPGFVTQFGMPTGGNMGMGGPIRVNGNLVWYGKNLIWLDPMRGESVQVAGDIRYAVPDTSKPDHTIVKVNGFEAKPSDDPEFDTMPLPYPDGTYPDVGVYRDGRPEPDRSGRPRSIFRLDAPILDARVSSNTVGRYRQLTRNSGVWKLATDPDGHQWWYNTGYYGWGDGLYIDNRNDVQEETAAYTLRGDWLNPGGSEYWKGPYYSPPGVSILLTPFDLDNDDGDNNPLTGEPDIVLTRTDGVWYDQNGNPRTDTGEMIFMPYPRNGVIFAEGNIRIKGMLPRDAQLTVVSGATIYVEGNILKYREQGSPQPNPTSSIALLATDHVCVNTTQFFAPVRGVFVPGNAATEEPHFEISPGSEGTFWLDFAFGDEIAKYGNTPIALYVRHTSDKDAAGDSFMNLLVNFSGVPPASSGAPWPGVYDFGAKGFANTPPLSYVYPLRGIKQPLWENAVFDLWPNPSNSHGAYDFNVAVPGQYNRLGFQFDEALADPLITKVNYLLSRVAIQPCDIRVEALMYAQNGSFFVIPGEWFNPDESDADPQAANRPPTVTDARFPCFGQPLDVKITIEGGVSENIPASVADVRAWMDKWGWIPPKHGSSTAAEDDVTRYREPLDPTDSNDPRRQGLTFVYDLRLACPRIDPTVDVSPPIRRDEFGRILPIAPALPVSGQTLYTGEPS